MSATLWYPGSATERTMGRVKNLDGVAKYVMWAVVGLVVGVAFAMMTGPYFPSGRSLVWPVFFALYGYLQAFCSSRVSAPLAHPSRGVTPMGFGD